MNRRFFLKTIITTITSLLIPFGKFARAGQTITSVKDGVWHDPKVWDRGRVPTAKDDVKVRHFISIEIPYFETWQKEFPKHMPYKLRSQIFSGTKRKGKYEVLQNMFRSLLVVDNGGHLCVWTS